MATPPFLHQPHHFSEKHFVPPPPPEVTQFLEDPTHPLWQGATHTRVSLNSDRPSIRAFTMHLTIIFRYKITDNTNIPGTTSKMFLPHVKTKNELTIFLAEKAIINFENVNGGYAVSYTTICISNLVDFAQEMMTHHHGEADKFLLLQAA